MFPTRPLIVAAVTVSLGLMLLVWERRRRRRRLSTDDTAMSSTSTATGRPSAASPQPPGASTSFATVADTPEKHIHDAQSKFMEFASSSSTGLTDVTASRQSVTDIRTDVEVIVSSDQEELVVPKSAEQFSTSAETVQTGEENLVTGSPFDEHSYCMPRGRATGGSVESVTSDSGAFSSYEMLSSPNERTIAEGALNVVAWEEVLDSSTVNSTQEDSPTNASADSSHGDFEPSLAREQAGDAVLAKAGTTSNSVLAESLTGGLLVDWVQAEQQQEQFADSCLQCSDNLPKHCLSTLADALKSDAGGSVIADETGLDVGTDMSQRRAERDQSSGTFDVNSGSAQEVSISVDITTMQGSPSLSLESSCSASIEIVHSCNGDSDAVELGRPSGCQVLMANTIVSEDVTKRDETACMVNVETDCPFVRCSEMQNESDNLCEKDAMGVAKKSEHVCSSATLAASAYSEVASADQAAHYSERGVTCAAAYADDGLRQFAPTGDAAEVISTPIRDDAAAFATCTVPLYAGSSQHEDLSSERATWSEKNMLSESRTTSVRSAGECSSPSNDNGSLSIADEECVPTDVNELHVTVASVSSIQPHCADTSAFDAAYDQQVAEYVLHDSSSISFVSSSAVSASSDALSLVTDSPERVNGINTVMTSVQDSVSRQSNSELRSGDARQNGNERVFKFYLPTAMCGLFIGKKGRNVNQLKAKSGAYIHVEALPTARDMHLCAVKGTDAAVTTAINAIIQRFPQLESELNAQLYPVSVAASPSAVDVSLLQLQLVPQTPVSVVLANVAASTRVFLQLPTHPTFPSLERLSADLLEVYSGAAAGELPPLLEEPVIPGSLCAVESEGVWYRGLIIQQLDPYAGDGSCMQLRYLDYGGYDMVPLARIRQLRPDFLTLPFQAVECSLAHVKPVPGADSLGESNAVATLASFTGYVLECINIGPDSDTGLPSVQLYANNNGVAMYINQLVSRTGGMEWLSKENAIH